ncbi:MAG: DUF624 domain-containing protein [Ruminococcus sp.]|nr:DUF624 domain-containing protein [Ruminococcus sp.]
MKDFVNSFMSNDSPFGKVMTKIGIIIAANLMFILFSLPVITIGASYTALYRVMLKTLRSGGVTNPFKQFWLGFKTSFLQSTAVWIVYALLMVAGYFGLRICWQAQGVMNYFQYAIYGVALILTLILIYTFPSIAAFEGKISAHIRNAIYFSFHKPWWIPVNLFFHIFPLYLTYSDPHMMPLYAFCWFFFGFGAITMLTARLLVKDYSKYLPIVDDYGDFILTEDGEKIMPGSPEEKAYFASEGISDGGHEKTEEEILEEMKKLDM